MDQQATLNEQLSKQEHRNVYLSELLKTLEERLAKAKGGSDKEIALESRVDLQIAQMKNLDRKIQYYRHELDKIKTHSTANVVSELRKLREDINIQHKAVDECRNELSTLLEEVNKMRAKDMGKERNKQMQKMFGEREYEMRILSKRLKELNNIENNQNYQPPPKKSARSFSQMIKEKDDTLTAKPELGKKSKIDKFAMYKNLVRFYTLEEEKLKKEIQQLHKERQDGKAHNESLLLSSPSKKTEAVVQVKL